MQGVLCHEVGYLKKLKILSLKENKLTGLPASLGGCGAMIECHVGEREGAADGGGALLARISPDTLSLPQTNIFRHRPQTVKYSLAMPVHRICCESSSPAQSVSQGAFHIYVECAYMQKGQKGFRCVIWTRPRDEVLDSCDFPSRCGL